MRSLFLAAFVLVTSSCASMHSRDDLDIAVGKHHIDLRWGRLENACVAVKPEMRAAFLKSWAEKAGQLEVQDIDIAGVVMAPDGGAADIIVNITFVERNTMQVKTQAVTEHWIRTDAGWLADRPAAL